MPADLQLDPTPASLTDTAGGRDLEALLAIADSSAHSLNNLLSSILLACHVLHAEEGGAHGLDMLGCVEEAATEARRLLDDLIHCLRRFDAEAEFPTQRLVEAVIHLARQQRTCGGEISTRYAGDVAPIRAAIPDCFDLLLDLVRRASDNLPEGALLSVEVSSQETTPALGGRPAVVILLERRPTEPGPPLSMPADPGRLPDLAAARGFRLATVTRHLGGPAWRLFLPTAS